MNNLTSRTCCRIALLCVAFAASGEQLDLLTSYDVQLIVEAVPEVVAAQANGKCPGFSITRWGDDKLWVQARGRCFDGSSQSTLINNYVVDRRNGVVFLGEGETPLRSESLHRRQSEVIAAARRRVLSNEEARCLAKKAMESLARVRETGDSFELQMTVSANEEKAVFSGVHRLPSVRVTTSTTVTVDKRTGEVVENATGASFLSDEFSLLAARVLAQRVPVILTTDDAVEIARVHPAFAGYRSLKCTEIAASTLEVLAERRFVGLVGHCAGDPAHPDISVSVDLRTGRVLDERNQRELTSPESAAVASRLLAVLHSRRRNIQKLIESACAAEHK